jgi:hypothetical protein
VLDPCLWELAEKHRVTGLAGVPHTFDQLEQLGFPEFSSLRYVTVAGGKLAANRVTAHVELGRRRGWDFFVMYGQTEATARMAYLTPELAEMYPHAAGVAIPGGRLRVDRPNDRGVGELIFAGPNVMMGYAHNCGDLGRGGGVGDLSTGDLAREIAPDVFEIVGRRSRFAKVFGLRLDLDEIERRLPFPVACVEIDGALGVVSPVSHAADAVAELCDIPQWTVRTVTADVPLTASGKPDRAAIRALVTGGKARELTPVRIAPLFETLLNRQVTPDDSFVSLGADSLSYVELSVRLGEIIDPLPRDWHRRSVADLQVLSCRGRRQPRWGRTWVSVDPTVVLRALAITLIVATHANLLTLMGGAHALLAVCGYNAARFMPADRRPASVLLRGAWRIALPSALWIGSLAVFGLYAPTTALFLNGALGANHWTTEWQFWFLEAAVWTLVGLAAALSIPQLRRLDARHPFGSALLLLVVTAAMRFTLVGVHAGPLERYSVPVVAWCFVLGWAAARTERARERIVVLVAAGVLLFDFFGDPVRELVILGAVAALLWARPIRLPRWAAAGCGAVAAASLSIYLTHWQVYPHLEDRFPLAATASSIVVGLLYHQVSVLVGRLFRRAMVDVDRRVERGADEYRDRQYVEQQQHRDGRGERSVDGRTHTADAQGPAHEVAAQEPHHDREEGARKTGPPRLPHRYGQVIQGRHEPDREHQYERPIGTP